jgi:hypothetical protein
MLGALLLNLARTPSKGHADDWRDVWEWYLVRQRKRQREAEEERKREKVLRVVREEEAQAAKLLAIAERIAADADIEARLERAAAQLAGLELQAMRARTARLDTILKVAEAIEAELEDEEEALLALIA